MITRENIVWEDLKTVRIMVAAYAEPSSGVRNIFSVIVRNDTAMSLNIALP